MRAFQSRLPILVLSLVLTACSTAGERTTRAPGSSRDVLTQEQLRAGGYTNALEAVRSLRSNWLTTRGPDSFSSPGQVQVYLDNTRLGGVDQLQAINTAQIGYIRYYDGIAASGRWGLDHGHGVIFVSSLPN